MRISKAVSLYLTHKHALGYRFRAEEAVLRAFCKAVDNECIENIDLENVLLFINGKGVITKSWEKKHRVLSGLFRFAQTRGIAEVSPLPKFIPNTTAPDFVPYIYSHEELKRMIDAVPAACGRRASIGKSVFKMLILLLYGTGLRIGEALSLTLGDVDLRQACLYIHETKFFKSRLVPLGKDLHEIVAEYILNHHRTLPMLSETPFFYSRDRSPLSKSAVANAFRRLRLHAGIHREGGAYRQPRIHDLRHTSAVHRLIDWYQNGIDLHKMLPQLATYLGHVNLASTQHYLTLTPELLQQASLRFEHYYVKGERS